MATMTAQWAPFALETHVDAPLQGALPHLPPTTSSSTTSSSSSSPATAAFPPSVASRTAALRIATLAETAEGFPSDVSRNGGRAKFGARASLSLSYRPRAPRVRPAPPPPAPPAPLGAPPPPPFLVR